jgi:hypothetical protein
MPMLIHVNWAPGDCLSRFQFTWSIAAQEAGLLRVERPAALPAREVSPRRVPHQEVHLRRAQARRPFPGLCGRWCWPWRRY